MKCSQSTDEIIAAAAEIIAGGGNVKFVPPGMSMFPFIVGGRDAVVLGPAREVVPGDIVAARIPCHGGCVLHRVYRRHGDRLELRGDASARQVEHCSTADVVGRVVAIERHGRRIDVASCRERLAALLWMRLIPLRRPLLWILRHMKGVAMPIRQT